MLAGRAYALVDVNIAIAILIAGRSLNSALLCVLLEVRVLAVTIGKPWVALTVIAC